MDTNNEVKKNSWAANIKLLQSTSVPNFDLDELSEALVDF